MSTKLKRTLDDIRENLDHVGCDNATALELCAEVESLRAQLAAMTERAEKAEAQQEVLTKLLAQRDNENSETLSEAIKIEDERNDLKDRLSATETARRLAAEALCRADNCIRSLVAVIGTMDTHERFAAHVDHRSANIHTLLLEETAEAQDFIDLALAAQPDAAPNADGTPTDAPAARPPA